MRWQRHPLVAALGTLMVLSVVALVMVGTYRAFEQRLPVSIEQNGVLLERIDRGAASLVPGGAAEGDLSLRTPNLGLVVGARGFSLAQQLRAGALLAARALPGSQSPLQRWRVSLKVRGRLQSPRIDDVLANTDGVTPSIEVRQTLPGMGLVVRTRFELERGRPWVEVVTRIENTGSRTVEALQLVDEIHWPGRPTFAPRIGEVTEATSALVSWIAREGSQQSYIVAFPEGPEQVDFGFDRAGPTDQVASSRGFELQPSETLELRRLLVVSREPIGRAVAWIWPAIGRRVGRVEGRLEPAPSWGLIRALYPDGRPLLEVATDAKGRYSMTLPEGEYRLVLESPGGVDEERLFIDADRPAVQASLLAPSPGRLRFDARNGSGEPLPTRWVIRGVHPTPNPDFGPAERAQGLRNVVYTPHGEGEVELPPGRYSVLACHGPEWSVAESEVEISADKGASVRATLEREVSTPGWIAAELHVHAAPSFDSSVTLLDRVASLVVEGIEFAAATDHNHVTDYAPASRSQGFAGEFESVAGVELTSTSWGHVNVYPYPQGVPLPDLLSQGPREIFAEVRHLGTESIIQVNHPRMQSIGLFNRAGLDLSSPTATYRDPSFSLDFDALEVINGLELGKPEMIEANLADWFRLLNLGYRFTAVGNSDSHRLIYQWPGYPRTYIQVEQDDPGQLDPLEVLASLRAGHAFLTTGPFVGVLVNGVAGPGDLLTADEHQAVVEVSVRAARWLDVTSAELWANGELLAQQAAAARTDVLARVEWQLQVDVEEDTWFVVIVRGERDMSRTLPGLRAGPLAVTNPIFVDGDGDGEFHARDAAPIEWRAPPSAVTP